MRLLAAAIDAMTKRSSRAVTASALVVATAVLAIVVLRSAWVAEDAFITFRTIDHFVSGQGLRWNPDERVQSYTHPLWLMLNVPGYFVTREICTTVTALGLACTLGSFLLVGWRLRATPLVLVIGLLLPLVGSRSFVLYSTSGFENSLSCLCWAAFAAMIFRFEKAEEKPWGLLGFACALGAVNRLDTLLVYLPPLAYLFFAHGRRVSWRAIAIGFSPLLAWLLFSTFYYGDPLPNTAFAKLNEEIRRSFLLRQGLFYALDLLVRDPVGFSMLLLGAAISVSAAARGTRRPQIDRPALIASLGAGAGLYCTYTIAIGGSFLSGRHFVLPIFISAALFADWLREGVRHLERPITPRRWAIGGVGVAILGGMLIGGPQIEPRKLGRHLPILAQPRGYKYLEGGRWHSTPVAEQFERWGRQYREQGVAVTATIGLAGLAAGPETRLIDLHGLSDPLLARLPPEKEFLFIGHFRRELPVGYEHARRSGSLEQMDPDLAEYYRPLRSVVSGPLFSAERLGHIAGLQLGRYDDHLEAYLERRALREGSM